MLAMGQMTRGSRTGKLQESHNTANSVANCCIDQGFSGPRECPIPSACFKRDGHIWKSLDTRGLRDFSDSLIIS